MSVGNALTVTLICFISKELYLENLKGKLESQFMTKKSITRPSMIQNSPTE